MSVTCQPFVYTDVGNDVGASLETDWSIDLPHIALTGDVIFAFSDPNLQYTVR